MILDRGQREGTHTVNIDYYLRKMKKTSDKGFFIFLFCAFFNIYLVSYVFSQQKVIQYSRDFEFKEGVYLSIFNFKTNNPIPRSKILFNSNKDDKDFFKYALDKNTFTYIDSAGKQQEIHTDKLWGYSSNGTLYINHGTDFNRVTIIGSLCHFVAVVPTRVGVYDPFNPYYQPYGSVPPRYVYVTSQYVLDYDTGAIVEFDVAHMEVLLQRDEALYKEFMALRKKQKRDGVFLYLRKYNEKHPIYFPVD